MLWQSIEKFSKLRKLFLQNSDKFKKNDNRLPMNTEVQN